MTSTLPIPKAQPTPVTDAWVAASWDEFLAVAQQPGFEKARTYYDNGYMRIETMVEFRLMSRVELFRENLGATYTTDSVIFDLV